MTSGTQDLAIIAGYGSLPVELARGAMAAGRHPFLIGIEGEAGEEIAAFPHVRLGWGEIGRLFRLLEERGIRQVVFAGGILRRPNLLKTRLDWGAIRSLPRALSFMIGGDNTVLTGAIRLFEDRGIEVVGAHVIAPQILVGEGWIAGRTPGEDDLRTARLTFRACKALGEFDVGQAAVGEARRIVALEGAEGTDALLERVATMRTLGRMPQEGRHGVLVKTMKPGQDERADLPAIGPRTVEGVIAAGLRGIAVEAGRTIILERSVTLEAAERAGLYVYGLSESDVAA